MKQQATKDLLLLNLGMLFISTSGVLGRYIKMSPELTIFWRTAIAATLLLGICFWQGRSVWKNVRSDLGLLFIGGFLMAVHWVTYFYALHLSNVAIGMLSLFTYPILTAVLEPILLGTKFQRIHLLLGILTIVGIYFLVPNEDVSGNHWKAIGMGSLSAASYALRNILMKKPIQRHDGTKLMFYQTLTAACLLFPFLLMQGTSGFVAQWEAILFLALFTTVIGHTLFLLSFRRFSVTAASIMSCTQPIYGIILGVLFLGEYPPLTTYIGGGLILTAVIVESYYSIRETRKD